MTTSDATEKKPLWLLIEENILEHASQDLAGESLEAAIQQIAGELDSAGYNVSRHGGNMLQVRWAMDARREVGRPLLKDFNAAVAAFNLEDVADPYSATDKLIADIGKTWPKLKESDRRADVIGIVEKTKLDLLIAKAKGLSEDEGIRLLIEEQVDFEVITEGMDVGAEKVEAVNAEIEKERAERARVEALLEAVGDKSSEEKIRHLFDNDVSEELIIEMAAVDQAAIDGVKQAMEEELKEKQRLAEEEAARKKAEAEGPALDDIPPDELLDHIEAIREIMEFSEEEKEIRIMCDQSAIPKALVDIAVTEPDKLDELEKKAEG